MPTFDTPGSIDLAIDVQVGGITVIAGDRTDTVVTVSASVPATDSDRRRAEETTIDFDGKRLTIVGPRPRFSWIGPGSGDAVDITVALPNRSRLTAEIAVGNVRTAGRLGATRVKNSTGDVELEATGDLWLHASHGSVTVDAADGDIDITADHGRIQVGAVADDAILKATHGSIQVGESGGDLEAKLSYGDLEITRALASVSAKTAYGSIRLHDVSDGSIEVESGFGQVVIGVRPGVPVWLDLASKEGRVRNELSDDSAPDSSEQTVAIRARTRYGDIDIRRSR